MFVSIVGDSISTYEGFVPERYAVFYKGCTRSDAGLNSVYDMWWAKVNQYLRAYICVNNSYSGSQVTGNSFPSASSDERTSLLHTAQYRPNMILVYLGFNDFGRGIPVKPAQDKRLSDTFGYAYQNMLLKLRMNYPEAVIVCGTIAKTVLQGNSSFRFPDYFGGVPLNAYNDAIRKAAKNQNCMLADIAALECPYESIDGTHPTANGQQTLAQCWIACLQQLGF